MSCHRYSLKICHQKRLSLLYPAHILPGTPDYTPAIVLQVGDPLVSEALYFNDPEGNGIEVYRDSPSSSWEWQNGKVKMDTIEVDSQI